MLKKLGFTTLGLAAALTLLAPTVTLARDRDDNRGRGYGGPENHQVIQHRQRAEHDWREHDRGYEFGARGYTALAPAANGYYDQFGNWHPYGYNDQYGYRHQ
jgi:hypothetical protein